MPRILPCKSALLLPPIKLIRFRFYMTEDIIYNIPFVYQKEITSLSNRKMVMEKPHEKNCILIIVNSLARYQVFCCFYFLLCLIPGSSDRDTFGSSGWTPT